MRSSRERGTIGENRAASYLEAHGMQIVQRNFRQKSGEIDIIGVDGEAIVFCEVKSWERMPIWGLEQALSRRKQGRIIRTSLRFLEAHPVYSQLQPRYDVIFVQEEVIHLRDAFSGNGAW